MWQWRWSGKQIDDGCDHLPKLVAEQHRVRRIERLRPAGEGWERDWHTREGVDGCINPIAGRPRRTEAARWTIHQKKAIEAKK